MFMKKTFLALAFFLVAVTTAMGDVGSSVCVIGPGAANIPACAVGNCAGTADSTTGTFDVTKNTYMRVQFYCTGGPCQNLLTVNGRSKCQSTTCVSPPWVPLLSCTNVTTAGICQDGSIGYINVPITMQIQVVQSATAGGTAAVILESHVVGK
jgi:hypothetical protein